MSATLPSISSISFTFDISEEEEREEREEKGERRAREENIVERTDETARNISIFRHTRDRGVFSYRILFMFVHVW